MPYSGGGGTFSGGTISSITNLTDDTVLSFGTTVSAARPGIVLDTAETPDTGILATGSVSNAWIIAERADLAFDFAHAVTTNPTLFIHSTAQTTTQWMALFHDGGDGTISTGAGAVKFPNGVVLESSSHLIVKGVSVAQFGNSGSGYQGGFPWIGSRTDQTPDSLMITTGTLSNAIQIAEEVDIGFDFRNGLAGTAAATNPAIVIHGTAQNTTEYNHLNMMGSHGGNVTALADNVATAFFHTPTVTNGQIYAGSGTYSVVIVDATPEVQVASGSYEWYAMRGTTGGTVCGIQQVGHDGVLPGLPIKATSSGTLTVALSCAVAANVATFSMTADTSLTPTTFNMLSQVNVRSGPVEVIAD